MIKNKQHKMTETIFEKYVFDDIGVQLFSMEGMQVLLNGF